MREIAKVLVFARAGACLLGLDAMRAIDARHAGRTLVEGVRAAIAASRMSLLPAEELADVLNAAFDRVALVEGDDMAHREALWGLLDALTTKTELR